MEACPAATRGPHQDLLLLRLAAVAGSRGGRAGERSHHDALRLSVHGMNRGEANGRVRPDENHSAAEHETYHANGGHRASVRRGFAAQAAPHGPQTPNGDRRRPLVSVVVPTKNEAGNVAPLLERLSGVLPPSDLEVIFVDDSSDATPAAIRAASRRVPNAVALIHRPPEDRGDGLAGAVVEGIRTARATWICVIDGDLQHPPELIPELLRPARSDHDVIVASRYALNGHVGAFGAGRSLVSRAATRTAKLLFPRRLRGTTDPLSGFFLVRRSVLRLELLRPRGFKILLEILVRTPGLSVSEVSFEFGARHAEESKASLREGARYVRQLGSLRLGALGTTFAAFGLVGASGLVVNMLAFAVLIHVATLHYLLAAVVATQLSTVWNFALLDRFVFASIDLGRSRPARLVLFAALNNAALLLRGPVLLLLVAGLGIDALVANLVSLVALTVTRFAISDGWIWTRKSDGSAAEHTYDVHGVAVVESEVALPELEPFRVAASSAPPTISVRIGILNRVQSDLLATLLDPVPHARYDEGLGRFGFGVDLIWSGTKVQVVASPLLRRSPHVLYTNVVEPILRWTLVEKGYALVHGACIAFDGDAHLITARTDTGKTTTILKTLEQQRGSFLSDDLTLVAPDGHVLAYPKPLTISRHTVRAVRRPLLSARERLGLVIQSRVHSRSGRRFAFLLTRMRLPVATINAVVQFLVPPPKYSIDRLIPGVERTTKGLLTSMIVITRGRGEDRRLAAAEAVDVLLDNSDDAFGFPPYASIAAFLQRRNGHDLRSAEREIVAAALTSARATVLHSTTMDWWTRIPALVGLERPSGPDARDEDDRVGEVALALE
jgi:dolichol-phosphate mannosyltransferase